MNGEGYLWGDATVTYPDMVGTAQLDERLTGRTVERVVGLDPKEWFVVGLDIGGGEHAHSLHVVAVHRTGDRNLAAIATANSGVLPVTDFLIHDVDPYAVLREITHMFELRLRTRASVGHEIRVVDHGDVPEQSAE